ncbi:hypothetical protein Tco_1418703 [Tanacetum coccineum]
MVTPRKKEGEACCCGFYWRPELILTQPETWEIDVSSLISLNRGSFNVIVGIDWLSKRKFVIVCHEKVVEIPLEGSRKLRVQGERTLRAAKALMNAKIPKPLSASQSELLIQQSELKLTPTHISDKTCSYLTALSKRSLTELQAYLEHLPIDIRSLTELQTEITLTILVSLSWKVPVIPTT